MPTGESPRAAGSSAGQAGAGPGIRGEPPVKYQGPFKGLSRYGNIYICIYIYVETYRCRTIDIDIQT